MDDADKQSNIMSLTQAYAELLERYSNLEHRHAQCESDLRRARETAARYKKRAKEWIDYAQQANDRVERSVARAREPRDARQHIDADNEVVATQPFALGHDRSFADALSQVEQPKDYPILNAGVSGSRRLETTSSQTTTVEESDTMIGANAEVKQEQSDEEPVVVSVRAVKRKRQDSTRTQVSRIKLERFSSPQAVVTLSSTDRDDQGKQPPLNSLSDLDDIGSPIQTPRRPITSRKHHANWQCKEQESRPCLRDDCQFSTRLDDLPIADHAGTTSLVRNTDAPYSRSTGSEHQRAALMPMSTNTPRSTTQKGTPSAWRKGRLRRSGVYDTVAMLAEDGERERRRTLGDHLHVPKQRLVPELDGLLESPSPNREVLSPDICASNNRKRVRSPLHGGTYGQAEESLPSRSPQSRSKTVAPQKGRQTSAAKLTAPICAPGMDRRPKLTSPECPSPTRPEEEPLRIRPLEALSRDDFKINPRYMGADFAFSDTLRGRDQRRGMHACTNPSCCGETFNKVIEIGGNAVSGKTDAEALEMYFGPTWADVMSSYGPDKRRDLVRQAHVHAFAEMNGKHKNTFERRSTPPGFWRTDMPTTQESSADRATAAEMERKAVEERWREALRPGGRWMFRDE